MKIVSIGDLLLSPDIMKRAVERFERYTRSAVFYFGPKDKGEMREYIRHMERTGSECATIPREIAEAVADADVLQVHMCPVPQSLISLAPNLKLIISNRGGVENIDVAAATKRGIPVLANPAHNANAVAEMTIGMILAETRNIARCHASMTKDRAWLERFPNSGQIHELRGSTAGLIGFGTIGRLTADLLRAFGVRVLVSDPFTPSEEIEKVGCTKVELDDLLKNSDIVSMHARVTPETTGMMGRGEFALMKPTAVFINSARSGLVDEDALYQALKSRQIMGSAIDVYPAEPLDPSDRLLSLDNITLTCHKGGDTTEAFANSPQMVLEQAENYFAGIAPRFLVNPEANKRA